MLHVYLQDYNDTFLRQLAKHCSDCFGMDMDARVKSAVASPTGLVPLLKSIEVSALFILEDAQRSTLDSVVTNIREHNALHYLVLRLNDALDAIMIRPAYYRACGFLSHPIDKKHLSALLGSIYADFSAANTVYGGFVSIKVGGTLYQLPYSKINFFEASGKKIVARTDAQEYEFYDSLEAICSKAPDFFLRVHRGFCINLHQVDAVQISDRTIKMKDDSMIPYSRTLKQNLLDAVAAGGR